MKGVELELAGNGVASRAADIGALSSPRTLRVHMRRSGVFHLGLLVLVASQPAMSAAPPREAATYVLAESRKSVSPAGERASAVRGSVKVLGGTARWDLETGTFPRTKANTLVLGERDGWLLDRKVSVAATAGLPEVRALFVPPAEGETGPFQSVVDDVEVGPAEVTDGPAFEGRQTARLRLTASWSLVMSVPGRVSRVRCRLTAVVDTLVESPEAARSPLDDLDRLFDAPDPVREAMAPELARARGLPVNVVVESEAELAVDYPGMAVPPDEGRKPLKTRTEATRTVSALVSRPAAEGDAAAFVPSEATRLVGLERLVEPIETLR